MNFSKHQPDNIAALFVKSIMVFEQHETSGGTILPFFADGYPGLLFHITPNGQWVQPRNKKMPAAYLYGQTLAPIELHMEGAYKIIIFQLYPFVLHNFFDVRTRDLNDNCYELQNMEHWQKVEEQLLVNTGTEEQIAIIMAFLHGLFLSKKQQLDYVVKEALQMILDSKAKMAVSELSNRLHITPRTLERRFLKEVGIPAKDFIQITRFQQSLAQLTVKDYSKLSDIVYTNGFADQSHFIRVFKAFTGKTPTRFIKTAMMV
jgi:AraC-like DNA-binding protein